MKSKKIIILMFSSTAVFFLLLQTIFAVVCCFYLNSPIGPMRSWNDNVFRAILYPFILMPLYFIIASYIDKYFSILTVVRINNRRKALLIKFLYKIGGAFIYVNEFFAVNLLLSFAVFGTLTQEISDFIFTYLCYFLGLVVSITFTEIFQRSELKHLNRNPYFITNLIAACEIGWIIPTLFQNTPFDYPILFSWIFCGGAGSVALILIEVVLAIYLFNVSFRKDIL